MKPEHGSSQYEPAFQNRRQMPDPSEAKAAPLTHRAEVDVIRDSVTQEPHLIEEQGAGVFSRWVDERRAHCSWFGTLGVTVLAGLIAGPFSLIGAMLSGSHGTTGVLYVVLFGPIIEELLKQSGMIYLVERKPYRVFASWQFFVAAWISALIFASVENVIYIAEYARIMGEPDRVSSFAAFRWSVCTGLHLCCATVAALGVQRVWKKQLESGRPADLSHGFPLIVTAIVLHGIYNSIALLFSDLF